MDQKEEVGLQEDNQVEIDHGSTMVSATAAVSTDTLRETAWHEVLQRASRDREERRGTERAVKTQGRQGPNLMSAAGLNDTKVNSIPKGQQEAE